MYPGRRWFFWEAAGEWLLSDVLERVDEKETASLFKA